MKVCIWGARGSLPASFNADKVRVKVKAALEKAISEKLNSCDDIDKFINEKLDFAVRGTFGTNTSCVQIDNQGDNYLICDSGTGIRDLGNKIMKDMSHDSKLHIHILLSHLHWDHVSGFPFFMPAYWGGSKITIYGVHDQIEEVLKIQHSRPMFPVDFDQLKADIEFKGLTPDQEFEIMGVNIKVKSQNHPDGSFGYRFEKDGKSVVFSTDCEHKKNDHSNRSSFIDFFRNADLLIMDAQYTYAEANSIKQDWGHSNNIIAAELAGLAGVKTLCLYHQEPVLDDFELARFLESTREYADLLEKSPDKIVMAWDGMTFDF